MIILTIKTNSPEAELGLFEITFTPQSKNEIEYLKWPAHKILSETLTPKIQLILDKHKLDYTKIEGILFYKGPGSFTGLRIGISVANSLAYSLDVPIVGTTNDDWIEEGISKLSKISKFEPILPFYGSPVHITQPRK
jgi:tRNA threonylcarbamoyladenosine biosynthesis protein TsaB